jgi:DNA processing protein
MSAAQSTLFEEKHSPGEGIANDLAAALALYAVEGVGSARFRSLLQAMGSPAEVFGSSERVLTHIPGVDETTAASICASRGSENGEELFAKIQECGAMVVTIWDEDYPYRLKEIHNPPALLFVRGTLPHADEPCLAIVGTRTPSAYGITQGHRIAEELASHGIGIVSGMARGIDTSAHEGCLQAPGRTYAIFGCGIDLIYPRENKSIAEKIEQSGGLISEFLPGTKPDPGFFPRRNRIISGLSLGVLVVQGTEKSGALITAKCALDQNRDVYALPGSVEDQRSGGPHSLIRQGAVLVNCADDILSETGLRLDGATLAKRADELPSLNPSEQELITRLSSDPIHIDQLVRETGYQVPTVLADLLGLEMKGWVVQLPGKMFALK